MKKLILLCFLLSKLQLLKAQEQTYYIQWSNAQADSIKMLLHQSTNDTVRMKLARSLGVYYQEINRDTSLYYSLQQLQLAKKLQQKLWEADAYDAAGWVLSQLKNFPLSLQYLLKASKIAEEKSTEDNIWQLQWFSKKMDPAYARLTSLGFIHNDLSQLYDQTGDEQKELYQLQQGLKIGEEINNPELLGLIQANLSHAYLSTNNTDSVIFFGEQALKNMKQSGYKTYEGYQLLLLAKAYIKRRDFIAARSYLNQSIDANRANLSIVKLPDAYFSFAEMFKLLNKPDSGIFYIKKALGAFTFFAQPEKIKLAFGSLYSLYAETGRPDSAFHYLKLYQSLSDSLNKEEKAKIHAYQNVAFDEQIEQQNKESLQVKKANTNRTYSFIAGIAILLMIAFLLLRNNRIRKKANELLTTQKQEIEVQKSQVESTLAELKTTQAQLIQSEKMASLGELTAGIAHEIQNPLNFVNNFSEVSNELVEELKIEKRKLREERDYQLEEELLNDISINLEKINHHGKRADAIVKGMLQHSQSSKGVKEPTDINKLADEYLRLAYHGIRAKDNSFNAILKTDFDETVGNISIIPQDIGRVILNLITNAFYAVDAKKKAAAERPGFENLISLYEPVVSIATQKLADKVLISVSDNGNGIPQNIIDKIFQPFFTTKPTGQGTGLGLSLAYDIVKAHNGTINVITDIEKGTTFNMILPLK